MRLLFIHGAEGYESDRSMAEPLASALGASLDYPEFTDSDMSVDGWATPMMELLAGLAPDDVVAAHSYGASMLLHALARTDAQVPVTKPRDAPLRVALLGMPNWGSAGWDYADYDFTGPEPLASLVLQHCRDDEVVPFEHLGLNVAVLPSATVLVHEVGGHQFDGLAASIAESIRGRSAFINRP